MARIDEDELIEHWTLIGGELAEVAGKRGPTRLAFAAAEVLQPPRPGFPAAAASFLMRRSPTLPAR